ncbi:Alpha-terpineol synthase [Carex littledalei]|uniref:Alpha-terpineol synthase n=1 Tax=Carex littledalei TaxID=544730 RepID=A0A833QI18_9POAL|nr:Alpha-terpineol synthase [Carex littledalei]
MATCFGASPVYRTQTRGSILAGNVRCCATSAQITASRRSANYQPNLWDYNSLESLKTDRMKESHANYETLKQEVKQLIRKETEPAKKLRLVDAMQRLGVAYHFDGEIKEVLGSISKSESAFKEDVLSMSLFFRLLRENSFPVSQDIFSSFLDNNGTFKPILQKDIKGLLSLYEASFLAFDGEELLDKARVFSSKHLTEAKPTLDLYQKGRVAHTLELPLHWRAPRLEARWFIDHYERDDELEPKLLQFGILHFNRVQTVHQGEIGRMSRWWKEAALGEKLTFARDRLVECFFYATGIVFEPHLSECREIVTKVFALIVHLDDVYDIYGTLEELVLFTDAMGKWSLDAMQELPEYMRPIYATILDTTNEWSEHVLKVEGWDPLPWLRTAWHDLCKAFLTEAKWHYGSTIPSLRDYIENGWMSSSGPLMLHHVFTLLGEKATAKALAEQESYPSIVRTSSMIFRLCNDSATHSAELERGDAPSSIACYMRENGANEREARLAMHELNINVWKKINKDALGANPFPRSFADASMNLARISHCIYQGGDGLGAPDEEKKKLIKSLFLEPVQVKDEKVFAKSL